MEISRTPGRILSLLFTLAWGINSWHFLVDLRIPPTLPNHYSTGTSVFHPCSHFTGKRNKTHLFYRKAHCTAQVAMRYRLDSYPDYQHQKFTFPTPFCPSRRCFLKSIEKWTEAKYNFRIKWKLDSPGENCACMGWKHRVSEERSYSSVQSNFFQVILSLTLLWCYALFSYWSTSVVLTLEDWVNYYLHLSTHYFFFFFFCTATVQILCPLSTSKQVHQC